MLLVASFLQSAIEDDVSQGPLKPDITLNLNQLDYTSELYEAND